MKVRDMPRQQQKAVFANMTDDGYLATLEGAEKYKQRKAYLLKRSELFDTYEGKIFNVYNNSKLTHRQKMARIAGLKKEATKKLDAYKAGESGSVVGEIRAENLRRFNKKYDIKEVPVGKNTPSFDKKTLLKYRAWQKDHPNFITPQIVKAKVNRERGAIVELSRGTDFEHKPMFGVTVIKPKGDSFKTTIGKENQAFVGKDAKQKAESYWLKLAEPHGDFDKDGVKNAKDCRPLDKKKQDITSSVIKTAERSVAAYQKSRTPKARIERAKAKLAKLKNKREAERLEQEVKEQEAIYKKAHPKKFGVF